MPRKIARIKKANGGNLLVLDLTQEEWETLGAGVRTALGSAAERMAARMQIGNAVAEAIYIFDAEDARAPLGFEVETLTCPESVLKETSE